MGEGSAVEPGLAERPQGRGGWGAGARYGLGLPLSMDSGLPQRVAASIVELRSLRSFPGAGPSLKKREEVDGQGKGGPWGSVSFLWLL